LPVSSCEAERSFSSLRRLKTYLRSTMSQSRLNSVALLHAHQHEVMAIPVEEILKDFVSLNSSRMQTFGTICNFYSDENRPPPLTGASNAGRVG